MQVSLSETYNIVSADMTIHSCLPVIGSKPINWLNKEGHANCETGNIVEHLEWVIHKKNYHNLTLKNQDGLEKFNNFAIYEWNKFLCGENH